jgi:uncharacterized membrane protein
LIDAETHTRLAKYEQSERSPIGLYAVVGLGAFAIALGLIAMVASNWAMMSRFEKLALDGVLGLLLAAGFGLSVLRERPLAREALGLIYYGYALASVTLIEQLYQLDGSWAWLLGIWTLLTAPFMALLRSLFSASVWLAGLSATYVALADAWIDSVPRGAGRDNLSLVLIALFPLLLIAAGRLSALRDSFRALSRVFVTAGYSLLFAAGFAASFLLYDRQSQPEPVGAAVVFVALLLGLLALSEWFPKPHWPLRARLAECAALVFGWIALAFGTLSVHTSLEVSAAFFQVASLGALSVFALALERHKLFNALTLVFALRLVGVYFEVFGSLLGTGLGLVTGGVLTLAVVWLWRRHAPSFTKPNRTFPGATHAH